MPIFLKLHLKLKIPIMKKIILTLTLAAGGAFSPLYCQSIWNGGTDTLWGTGENWSPSGVPADGANVEIAAGSGTAISLGGVTRTVGTFTLSNNQSLTISTGTMAINTGIVQSSTAAANTNINSAVSLSSNITVALNAANRQVTLSGNVSGSGNVSVSSAAASPTYLRLDGNNSLWDGGLTLGTAAANSAINIGSASGLGTGTITWTGGTSYQLTLVANTNYTLSNNFNVSGYQIINTLRFNTMTGKSVIFNGNFTGTGNDTIQFSPRTSDITDNITELNGVNTNANSASRIILMGSTNDTSGALGNTYLIGNNHALDWGRVILGATTADAEAVAMLYKNGITISRLIELADWNSAASTLGVSGTGASATQSGDIQLSSFGGNFNKTLVLTADTDSTFTLSGRLYSSSAGDVLSVEKTGAGIAKLTRSAGNSYTGATTVSAGTLLIANNTGSGTGTGAITVAAGATLAGTSRLAPAAGNNISIAGTLSPGDGVGTMTLALSGASKLDFATGSHLALTLGTTSDQLAFETSGDWVTGGGNLTLDLFSGAGFAYDQAYTVITNLSTDFMVAGVTLNGVTLDGSEYVWTDLGSSYQITVVPEPGAGLLFAAGLLSLFALKRFRVRQNMESNQ